VTFANETASGWQQANFAVPVAVTANTTYVVSYFTPTGHYSSTDRGLAAAVNNGFLHGLADGLDGANGVYRYGAATSFPNLTYNSENYWVDLLFSAATMPAVYQMSATPGLDGKATIAWTTDTPASSVVAYGTTSGSLTLNAGSPSLVTSHNVTLTGLTQGTTYFFRVTSVDASGNSATSPATAGAPASFLENAISIWSTSTVPAIVDAGDPNSVEVGMKFRSDVAGSVIGMRFYQSAANTGTHVGHLWTNTGVLLATVTFTGETGSGWQDAYFSAPVAINANTTYLISYYAPAGHYSATGGYFTTGTDHVPLHALANGVDGPNGVYAYGGGGFPSQTFNSGNYWVDVIFR
jgi:hypothetical protein